MTDFTTTARGDRVAYDRYGSGPGLVFIAGAGPFRAVDPITTETAERAADLGVTAVVFDRLGRGESPPRAFWTWTASWPPSPRRSRWPGEAPCSAATPRAARSPCGRRRPGCP